MRGGRLGGMGRGGFGGGIGGGGGMGVNPLIGLAGLGMFGMMMRPSGMGNMGNRNRQGQGKIKIVAANGGENWKIGSTQTISWIANGLSGDATIELARDGGKIWDTIVDSTPIHGE